MFDAMLEFLEPGVHFDSEVLKLTLRGMKAYIDR